MQSLRLIKNRIRSIESTKKVTNALELVSVSKLNKLERALYASRPYVSRLESVVSRVSAAAEFSGDPLFQKKPRSQAAALCVVTADGGLCGTYNNNVLRAADGFLKERSAGVVELVAVGKKAAGFFKARGYACAASFTGLNVKHIGETARDVHETLVAMFLAGKVGEVSVLYTRFESALIQKVALESFLPLSIGRAAGGNFLCEPAAETVLARLMPRYCAMRLRLMLLESFTSEYAARTIAMNMATENAKELLHGLVLKRNKVRQARITQDIMEIISSAEALKG